MNPIINITKKPINDALYGEYKDRRDIYFINVSEGKLLMDLIALPKEDGSVSIKDNCHLTLLGIDDDANYPAEDNQLSICKDPYISIDMFKESLSPYGINFKKADMKSMKFFKVTDFTMNEDKKNHLELLIKERLNLLFKY